MESKKESKSILWGIKYNTYTTVKNEILQSISSMGYVVSDNEKYSKIAILNELKNKRYDYLFLSEGLEEKKYTVKDLEEIIDNNPYLRVVYIVNKDYADTDYLNALINLGESIFAHVIHVDDFTVEKVMSVLRKPRTRVEAKLYLDIELKMKNKVAAVFDKNLIAAILLNIQKITSNEEKILAFRAYIERYTTEQTLELLSHFPPELLEILKEEQIVNAYISSRTNGGPVKIKIENPAVAQSQTQAPSVPDVSQVPPSDAKEKLIIKETILVSPVSSISLFSKKIYTIVDNPEMGVDIAMILSKDYKTLLIDFDPLGPSLQQEIGADIHDKNDISCLHKLLLVNNKRNSETFRKQIQQYKANLDVCTTLYEPALQRKFTVEDLTAILETAYDLYDFVIVLCSQFNSNVFNQVATRKATNIIVSVEPYINSMERTLTHTYSRIDQNEVLTEKVRVVVYNSEQSGAISEVKARKIIKEFGFTYWGTVPVSDSKLISRNDDKYIAPDNTMMAAYREILLKENIHISKPKHGGIRNLIKSGKREKKRVISGDFFDTYK